MPTTINDELLRIESAKAAIATAIGNKGVTVPANAKIDDFADLIAAIQTGGANPNLQSKSVSITTNGTTNVVADSGYDGLSAVNISTLVPSKEAELKRLIDRSVTSIDIPSGITKIGENAFSHCSSLVNVTIPNTVTRIETNAFYNTAIKSITIPEGVTYLGQYVFRASSLESLTIPNSVTSTGGNTVYQCTHLVSLTIGSGITFFPYQMCNGCLSLEQIVIPSNIPSITAYGFYNTNLKKIVLMGNTITLSNTNAFSNTPIANGNGDIYVPLDKVNDYKTATNWQSFSSIIKGWKYDASNNIVDENNNIIVNADGTFPQTT